MFRKKIFLTLTILLCACTNVSNNDPTNPTPPISESSISEPIIEITNTVSADQPQISGLVLADGFQTETLPIELTRPMQMIKGPENSIWVSQLSGSEGGGTGQIVSVSLTNGTVETILTDLLNPTGIALLDNYLWVAAGRDLLRIAVDNGQIVGEIETIFKDLPFNSRSNGTLTVTPAKTILYETSGGSPHKEEDRNNSGILWELDPVNLQKNRPIAIGLKNPYAHVFDAEGRLWVTEIAEDNVDGKIPADEINLISPNAHFGWPFCYEYQIPARNYGGTQEFCDGTISPVALFPPHATPTGIAVSPWQDDTLLVSLWLTGEIMQIPISYEGNYPHGEPEVLFSGFRNPHHLLIINDELFISEFTTGKIYRVFSHH